MLYIKLVIKQIIIPQRVGRIKLNILHFILLVSFFILNKVAQGKCKTVKIITLIALVVTNIFSYNEKTKSSDNNGFLTVTI